ncbi:MAG TPA: hypothetical protein VHQ24_15100 [Lachnospiraceae bacterium]|nr:hypothetical protein [Lachnospiraceae bacterium]
MRRNNLKNVAIKLAVATFCMVIGTTGKAMISSADTTEASNGIVTLDTDKTYEYDLNGDGTPEKILYKSVFDEESYSVKMKLYINGKLCYSKVSINSFGTQLQVLDIDTSDSYQELYLHAVMDSDGICNPELVRYDGEKLTKLSGFNPNKPNKYFDLYRFGIDKVNGDGTFTIFADTPIYSDAFGCYTCEIKYQVKGNTVSLVPTKTYSFTQYSRDYKYVARVTIPVYVKAGSKTVSFRVKKGESLSVDKFYVTQAGKVYIKVINSKGESGWVKSKQQDLFKEIPQWG